jgi:hypothetical protein
MNRGETGFSWIAAGRCVRKSLREATIGVLEAALCEEGKGKKGKWERTVWSLPAEERGG